MMFADDKAAVLAALGKPDRSRKGTVDEDAWPFLNLLNNHDDYYTTSSCAGRISVFAEPQSGKKHDGAWLFVTHSLALSSQVRDVLNDLPSRTLWLRMEPPIFHVACRTQEAAERLVRLCQSCGFKRSGIISSGAKSKERLMVEIVGNERLDTPIASEGKPYFDDRFITFLVMKANEKLSESRKRLDELLSVLKESL